jgi:uncharacterized protein
MAGGTKTCAICGKPVDLKLAPFCSRRCADVDLHRWFSGVYSVPVVEDEDEDGEKPSQDGEQGTK